MLRTLPFADLAALPPRSGSRCTFTRRRLRRSSLSTRSSRLSDHVRPPATHARYFVRKVPRERFSGSAHRLPTSATHLNDARTRPRAFDPRPHRHPFRSHVAQTFFGLRPKPLGTTGYPTDPSEPPRFFERVSPLALPVLAEGHPSMIGLRGDGPSRLERRAHVFRVSSPPRKRPCTRCRRHAACEGRRLPPLVQRHGRRSPSFAAPRRAALPEGSRVLSAATTPARALGIAPSRPPGLPLPSRRLDEALLRRRAPL